LKAAVETDLDRNLENNYERISLEDGVLQIAGPDGTFRKIDVSALKGARIEDGVGIGKLILLRSDGKEDEVAYFTRKKLSEMREFCAELTGAISGKKMEAASEQEKESGAGGRKSTLLWLVNFMRPYRSKLIGGLLLSIVLTGLNLVPAYLLKDLIDEVLLSPHHPEGIFLNLTLILLVSYMLIAVVTLFQNYVLNTLGQRVVNDLRYKVYSHAIKLPSSSIERITTGRILSRLTTDVGNAQWLMVWGVPTLTVNILTLVGIGVILFITDVSLAIYVLIPVPFIIWALISYRRRSHLIYHRNWRRSADVTASVSDTVPGYAVIKSFANEDHESKRIGNSLDSLYESQVDVVKMNLTYWPAIGFMTSLATIAIWWVGGKEVIAGTIQLGVITLFVSYMALFYAPINNLSNTVPFIQQAATSGDRLRELLEARAEDASGKSLPSLSGDIVFRNVEFGYEKGVPVLKDFNLNVRKGEKLAIVGRSGSGKTSVSRLLLRFNEGYSGAITIGDTDLKQIDIHHLRQRIAYVPQEVVLFDNTVAYNVTYSTFSERGEVDCTGVIRACMSAGIHDEVMALSLAYDTNLGEKGSTLSGGQRQRISLARALLRRPDIIILDEATSYLDVLSEREIYSRMITLVEGRTAIIITHNVFEALSADRVVVMKEGRIIQEGRPSDLLSVNGEFKNMFREFAAGKEEMDVASLYTSATDRTGMTEIREISGSIGITQGRRESLVNVETAEGSITDARPYLPFPISNTRVVLLRNSDGKWFMLAGREEITSGREILERAVKLGCLRQKVDGIERISVSGDELQWELRTAGKIATVTTRGRRNVIRFQGRIVLIDTDDDIYEIDMSLLDRRSSRMVNRTI